MDFLLNAFHSVVNTLSNGNGMGAGVLSAAIITSLMVYARNVPVVIWKFVKSRMLVQIYITKDSPNSDETQNYLAFLKWFDKSYWAKFDRNRQLQMLNGEPTYGPGIGFHWFFYKRRFVWFTIESLQSMGVEYEKERVSITTFGRNTKIIEEIFSEFVVKYERSYSTVYSAVPNAGDFGQFQYVGRVPHTYHQNMVFDPAVEKKIFGGLDWWLTNREWFDKRNLDYKRVILLDGPPGTGKTSLTKSIASYTKRNVYSIDIASIGPNLLKYITNIPPGSIIALEDFEAAPTLHRRDEVKAGKNVDAHKKYVALSQLLNILQGMIQLENFIIVATTNHLEKLDPAIYRRGRVDILIAINALKDPEIRRYAELSYEGIVLPKAELADLKAADMGALFQEYPHDPIAFVASLKTL